MKNVAREALYLLPKCNKDINSENEIRTQDKGSTLIIEYKEKCRKIHKSNVFVSQGRRDFSRR